MKNKIIIGLLAAAFIFSPVFASAQTSNIAALYAEIARLQALIAELTARWNQTQTQFCHNFNVNLGIGAIGSEVNALSGVLVGEGFSSRGFAQLNSTAAETIARFQEKYASEILTPLGLTRGTGYVGPSTRAVLNRLYGCGAVRPQVSVFITPTSLPNVVVGDEQTETSERRLDEHNSVFIGPNYGGLSYVLTAHGFSVPSAQLEWSVVDGSLPRGLSLMKMHSVTCMPSPYGCPLPDLVKITGSISRDFASFGPHVFTVQATDGTRIARQNYTLTVISVGEDDDNLPPTISGVSGPTTLKVGEQGTWTVRASDPENGNLRYQVIWGDEIDYGGIDLSLPASGQPPVQQTSTFTHTYRAAGTYNPTFIVTDTSSQSSRTSLSVVIGPATTQDITVLSPNGGETWKAFSVEPIRWNVRNNSGISKIDLYLQPTMPPCGAGLSCIQAMPDPIVLDKNIQASLIYNWIVATDIVNNPIYPGNYWMRVCPAGPDYNDKDYYREGKCDESDRIFTISQ